MLKAQAIAICKVFTTEILVVLKRLNLIKNYSNLRMNKVDYRIENVKNCKLQNFLKIYSLKIIKILKCKFYTIIIFFRSRNSHTMPYNNNQETFSQGT